MLTSLIYNKKIDTTYANTKKQHNTVQLGDLGSRPCFTGFCGMCLSLVFWIVLIFGDVYSSYMSHYLISNTKGQHECLHLFPLTTSHLRIILIFHIPG